MKEHLEKKYWDTADNLGEIKRSTTNSVVKLFNKQRIDYLSSYIDFASISNALDVGCGTGFSSINHPTHISITGIDFSIRNLRINPIQTKIQASSYNLPFTINSFDLVYGWDFLHHLENPEKAVKEMARVSKKFLVLFEPNRNNPIQFFYSFSNKNERGTLQFTKNKLLEFLNEINFKLISCETVGCIFAGATPEFLLPIFKSLPFKNKLGISTVLICKKLN